MNIYSQRHPNQWYVPDSLNGQNSVIPPKFKLFDLFDLQLQMYITFLRYLYDKPYVFHHLKYSLESLFWDFGLHICLSRQAFPFEFLQMINDTDMIEMSTVKHFDKSMHEKKIE